MVLTGGDEIVINDKKYLLLANSKRVQVITIPDANNFFRDLYADDAVDAIVKYLKGAAY